MLDRIVGRWRVWNSPQARQRRKAERRLAWREAGEEADARRDREHPRPEGFWDRGKGKKP